MEFKTRRHASFKVFREAENDDQGEKLNKETVKSSEKMKCKQTGKGIKAETFHAFLS